MRRVFSLTVVGLLVLAACGGNGDDTNGENGAMGSDCADRTAGMQALIELEDNQFADACTEMTTTQGFEIRNNGANLHNLSIDGVPMVDVDLEPGDANNTESPQLDAGVYTMFCKYHRDGGMEAELQIIEG